ncbi:hypothetical protein LINPERHAP2_LOCUS33727 [Linum perenne]
MLMRDFPKSSVLEFLFYQLNYQTMIFHHVLRQLH